MCGAGSADPWVISINISQGGVPKLPVESLYISKQGLEGDGHDHAKHYRLTQAVCLQDIEQLEKLAAMGYPLGPGTAGENLTVKGLDVNGLPVGTLLEFTGGVVLEITRARPTCYVMDRIHPTLKDDATGCHGMYARVLVPGRLHTGARIAIRQPSAVD